MVKHMNKKVQAIKSRVCLYSGNYPVAYITSYSSDPSVMFLTKKIGGDISLLNETVGPTDDAITKTDTENVDTVSIERHSPFDVNELFLLKDFDTESVDIFLDDDDLFNA
jgi:hypothetical protein